MSVREIKKLELNNEVESIEASGFKIWPIIRFALSHEIQGNYNTNLDTTMRNVKKNFLFKFFYGFKNLFKNYDCIIFSDSSERKKINDFYIDKSVDKIAEFFGRSIIFETPLPAHYKKSQITTNYIASKLPLYLIIKIVSFFLRLKYTNKQILEKLLIEAKVQINYDFIVKNFISQYYAGRLLYFLYRPKVFVVQCYYTNLGYVKAFNDCGIKVIEAQHGLINENHSAYNIFKNIDQSYYPNFLISYGEKEKEVFAPKNHFIKKENVKPAGHFYLDLLLKSSNGDKRFNNLKRNYKTSVTISVQEIPIEKEFIQFIINAAILDETIIYIYKTRFKNEDSYRQYNLPENVIFVDWLNIYELILYTDYHVTMYSTCAIEALSLGKPNILIDLNNLSTFYLSNLIAENKFTKKVSSPTALIDEINSENETESPEEIILSNSKFIKPNYLQNINTVLKEILNDH